VNFEKTSILISINYIYIRHKGHVKDNLRKTIFASNILVFEETKQTETLLPLRRNTGDSFLGSLGSSDFLC
jgi:hypothetical protein